MNGNTTKVKDNVSHEEKPKKLKQFYCLTDKDRVFIFFHTEFKSTKIKRGYIRIFMMVPM